jgi:hypothetical protein
LGAPAALWRYLPQRRVCRAWPARHAKRASIIGGAAKAPWSNALPHGIFNKAEQTAKCFFWVSPTRKLYDLFWAIHSMKEQNPPDVVALSARYEVMFLPPPAE